MKKTDKKSFILQIEDLKILDKMTDKQAGIFIKSIYEYQTKGKIKEKDFTTVMALAPIIEKFKSVKPKKPKKTSELNPIYIKHYEKLKDNFIEKSLPKTKPQFKKWVDDIRKMIEKDKYSFERIEEIIIYLRSDRFWSGNFHSLLKLRKPLKSQPDIKLIDFIDDKLKNKTIPPKIEVVNDGDKEGVLDRIKPISF